MNYYAVQVQTARERTFIERIEKQLDFHSSSINLLFFQRRLLIKKNGEQKTELRPLFPGYIFVETAEEISSNAVEMFRATQFFTRFLKSNKEITPVTGHDLELLHHFMQFGETADISQVEFDENSRIIVKEGPLKGLEGCIINVDRHKKRVKIKIDFEDSPVTFDLSYTDIEKGVKNKKKD